ncbi:hypothetical protein [Amaricoccus sp.]|uniref:hypothetical protein n=1 Tax=Amaricoccus sp. TaxID=1872485 RepID=UPI001B612F0B|nr:hypothetical protein [Amaricoccus sp.]MBP7000228.1 hypothetical protein [Amaricoccus sp.]
MRSLAASDTAPVVPAARAVNRRSRVASDPAKPGAGIPLAATAALAAVTPAATAALAAVTLAAAGIVPAALAAGCLASLCLLHAAAAGPQPAPAPVRAVARRLRHD